MKRCHRGGCGQGKEDSCCPGRSDACNNGGGDGTTQPPEHKMETEEKAQPTSAGGSGEWSSEHKKDFLHNIGETVNSFLGPLGIKVDVDVVDDKKPSSEGATPNEASNTAVEVRRCSLVCVWVCSTSCCAFTGGSNPDSCGPVEEHGV